MLYLMVIRNVLLLSNPITGFLIRRGKDLWKLLGNGGSFDS